MCAEVGNSLVRQFDLHAFRENVTVGCVELEQCSVELRGRWLLPGREGDVVEEVVALFHLPVLDAHESVPARLGPCAGWILVGEDCHLPPFVLRGREHPADDGQESADQAFGHLLVIDQRLDVLDEFDRVRVEATLAAVVELDLLDGMPGAHERAVFERGKAFGNSLEGWVGRIGEDFLAEYVVLCVADFLDGPAVVQAVRRYFHGFESLGHCERDAQFGGERYASRLVVEILEDGSRRASVVQRCHECPAAGLLVHAESRILV